MKSDDSEVLWVKNFKKNQLNNRQLSFVSNMYISAVTSDGIDCDLDMLKLRCIEKISQKDDSSECFVFDCDLRSHFTKALNNATKGKLICYFPLSREKFKVDGEIFIEQGNNKDENTSTLEELKNIFSLFSSSTKNRIGSFFPAHYTTPLINF